MSTELAEQPVDTGSDEPEVIHFWCCDPDVAWCGEPLEGEYTDEPDDSNGPYDCALCVLAESTGTGICKYCYPVGNS